MPVKGDYLNKVFTGLHLQQTKKKSRGRPFDIKTLKDKFYFFQTVVKEMNRLGMFIDLSHVSHKSMHDVLDVTKAPGKYIIWQSLHRQLIIHNYWMSFCDILNYQDRGKSQRLVTLTETLVILDITKTATNNCFIVHFFQVLQFARNIL